MYKVCQKNLLFISQNLRITAVRIQRQDPLEPRKGKFIKKMKVTSSGHCIFACCMTRSYNKHKHFKIIHKIKLFMTSFSTINTVCPVKEIIFCNSCLSLYKTCNICLVILFATYFGSFFNIRMNVSV